MGNLILPNSEDKTSKLLYAVYGSAIEQAVSGKGKDRHNRQSRDFMAQPIMTITRDVGLGFPIGQCCKKATESIGLLESFGPDAAIHELLGAMNYLAAAVIYLGELSTSNSTGE